MTRTSQTTKYGFTAYQLKVIALLAMTIYHLATYGSEIPILDTYRSKLEMVGCFAAPLFLFTVTESVRYTSNRKKYLLRLYLGAVGVGLFVTVTNIMFENSIGRFINNNILFTYLYTAIYIILIEEIFIAVKCKKVDRLLLCVVGIFATCIVHFLYQFLEKNVITSLQARDLVESFIVSPLYVDYSIAFVILGVLIYFSKNKYWKASVLLCFSVLCGNTQIIESFSFIPFISYYMGPAQRYMIFAIPFILLYSGDKGKDQKWLFYAYYPIHRYVISIVVYIFQHFGVT